MEGWRKGRRERGTKKECAREQETRRQERARASKRARESARAREIVRATRLIPAADAHSKSKLSGKRDSMPKIACFDSSPFIGPICFRTRCRMPEREEGGAGERKQESEIKSKQGREGESVREALPNEV